MSTTTPNTANGGWNAAPEPPTADPLQALEQAVLGSMLLSGEQSGELIGEISQILQAQHFRDLRHAAIFTASVDLFVNGSPAGVIAVSMELEQRGELKRVGGAPYLHTCLAAAGGMAASGPYHAEKVLEASTLRQLGEAANRIAQYGELAGASGGADLAALQASVQAQVDAVFDTRTAGLGYTSLESMWAEAFSDLDDIQAGRLPSGLPSGLADLDEVTGGWKGGQMVIVAARPGIGKSTLGVDFAREATFKQGKTTAIFSLEMSGKELWQRIVSAETKIRFKDLTTPGALAPEHMDRIARFYSQTVAGQDGQIVIDDNPSMTVATIRAKARTIARNHDLGLIVVDYLQLLTSGGRAENRQQEVSEFSRQLKLLAKELNVPLVAISQLNRGPESRADKRPLLADLRESGSLEQDADIVILVNRPDYYDRDDPRGGEADLILAKHRGGPTTTVAVAHQLHYCRFASLAPQ